MLRLPVSGISGSFLPVLFLTLSICVFFNYFISMVSCIIFRQKVSNFSLRCSFKAMFYYLISLVFIFHLIGIIFIIFLHGLIRF
ncbi:MAG: hypothetical protein [Microviridae sp.]|nr:MAG: hypothetical protein [Microviridae sp.]